MEEIINGWKEAIKVYTEAYKNDDKKELDAIAPVLKKYHELLESKGYEHENVMTTSHCILKEEWENVNNQIQ